MKPFFLKLKPYTKGHLSDLFKLKSTYTKKIYLLCSKWKKAGSFTIKVKDLMDNLGIKEDSSYLIYNRFKEKVPKVAEKNMIEKSRIYFEYEEIKRGKRVNELLFIIKDNPAFKQEKAKEQQLFTEDATKPNVNIFIGKKIYAQDKLFFFTGLEKKDGVFNILLKDTQEKKAKIETQFITEEKALEQVQELIKQGDKMQQLRQKLWDYMQQGKELETEVQGSFVKIANKKIEIEDSNYKVLYTKKEDLEYIQNKDFLEELVEKIDQQKVRRRRR
jgi:hypothetical protein